MPSSYTASLRFEQQFTGENVNTWGVRLNTALSRVDFSIAGHAAIAMTGGTYVLSTSNTTDDEARAAVLNLSGAGGTLRLPPVPKNYRIVNGCSGGATATTGSGATVVVDAGDTIDVHCDGTNVKTPGVGGLTWKQYISSVVIGTISGLPAVAGNDGKVMAVVAGSAVWKTLVTTDVSDYGADQTTRAEEAEDTAFIFSQFF